MTEGESLLDQYMKAERKFRQKTSEMVDRHLQDPNRQPGAPSSSEVLALASEEAAAKVRLVDYLNKR